jgi:hypothetical protein
MKKLIKKQNRAIVTLRLPPKLIEDITRTADDNGVSKTQLIETAIREYLLIIENMV